MSEHVRRFVVVVAGNFWYVNCVRDGVGRRLDGPFTTHQEAMIAKTEWERADA